MEILDGFEQFAAQARGTIRVDKSGRITFGKLALENYVKGNNFATFYFNKETNQIAIKLSEDEPRGSVNITKYETSAYVSCTAFFRYYKINLEESVSTFPDYIEEENLLIMDIPNTSDLNLTSERIP